MLDHVSSEHTLSVGQSPEEPVSIADKILKHALVFSKEVSYKRTEKIIISGTESLALYYVIEGAVEVSHSTSGTKIVVALIGAGNFFGEIGFFDGTSRIRDIRATKKTRIAIFDQQGMARLQQEAPTVHSEFMTFLTRSICLKFRRVLEEREPMTGYAASLSTGGRSYDVSKPLPDFFFKSATWQDVNRIVDDFKSKLFNVSFKLQKDPREEIPEDLKQQCITVLNGFYEQLLAFKGKDREQSEEDLGWGYIFKEIYPYFMRSPLSERIYFKPKGYAGDFLMMEQIYRNVPEGDGKLGVLVDGWCLDSVGARAIRGRRRLLREQLAVLSRQKKSQCRTIKIMNLACGSNRELFDFIKDCDYSEQIEALCMDIDSDALAFTDQQVNVFSHQATIRLMSENLVKWALGKVIHDIGDQDIIYSSGLTDYLDTRLFIALVSRCHEHLKPGGKLIVGNFAPNPDRTFMDHILQWRLIYRNEEELRELFRASPFRHNVRIISEEQGVNLFAVATKDG
ncbi:MAG: cyclic nucleotide-binding domain-containing protein [Desulfobulbaceae bacterium]|nr:cyclic nucleotide-binding domain-containing protein [Desulfobulbaceae bacterium]